MYTTLIIIYTLTVLLALLGLIYNRNDPFDDDRTLNPAGILFYSLVIPFILLYGVLTAIISLFTALVPIIALLAVIGVILLLLQ